VGPFSAGGYVARRCSRAGQSSHRGRVAAAVSAVASVAQIGSYALGGLLASVLSPPEMYLAAGLLGLVAPLLFGRSLLNAAGPRTAAKRLVTAAG
jgi:MFS family permease